MSDAWTNPMGTDGFEFLEFAAPEPARLDKLFRTLGFSPVACHRAKDVTLYRQGAINLILNAEPASFAQAYARVHGPSVCAIALRVANARAAAERAERLGAEIVPLSAGPMELNIPAIRGIGGSLIYLVDRYEGQAGQVSIYDIDFVPIAGAHPHPPGIGLTAIHRLDHTVHPGRRGAWAGFFARLFNFRDAGGCLESPCGRIRLAIDEPTDTADPVEGFLDAYRGEGIRRVAFAAADLGLAAGRLRDHHIAVEAKPSGTSLAIPTDGTLGPVSMVLVSAEP